MERRVLVAYIHYHPPKPHPSPPLCLFLVFSVSVCAFVKRTVYNVAGSLSQLRELCHFCGHGTRIGRGQVVRYFVR